MLQLYFYINYDYGNSCKIVFGKRKGKRQFGGREGTTENNVKLDLQETGFDVVKLI
jgi:hypothetical protein